jgi:membrane protease YdiL (CAAX protease family)
MHLMRAGIITAVQLPLLLMLLRSDRNDGGKNLFKQQRWSGGDAALAMLSFDAFLWLCILLAHVAGFRDTMDENSALLQLCMLLIVVGLFKFKYKESMSALGFSNQSFARWVFSLVVAISLITAAIIDFRLGGGHFRKVTNDIQDAFGAIVIAPIAEEAVARGILYSPYRKKYGVVVATLVTAALFGTMHLTTPAPLAIGIALAILYEKSQSFTLVVAGHSLLNAVAFIIAWRFPT